MTPPRNEAIGLMPRHAGVITAAVVALGFLLRAHGFLDPWLNPDEGIYYQLTLARSWDHFLEGVVSNAHPPLQYLLLRAIGGLSSDFAVLRVPSLVAGTLAVYAVIRLGHEAVSWRTGLIAGVLLAASPGAIMLSQVMRPYALLMALLAAAAWLAFRHLRTGQLWDLVAHTMLLALAVSTHYAAFVALPAFGGLLVGEALAARRPRRELLQRCAAQTALLGVVVLAYLLHLRPHLIGGFLQREAQRGWLGPYMHESVFESWLGFIGVQRYLFGQWFEAPAVILFAAGLVMLIARRRLPFALLVSGVVATAVAAAMLQLLPLGSTRHSAYLGIFTLPVVAAPIGLMWDRSRRQAAVAAGLVAAAVIWPAAPRLLTGAQRLDTRSLNEHVTSAAAVRTRIAEIEEWTREPMLIVIDRQTFRFLAPIFHSLSSPDRHGPGAVLAGFPWGRADVIVSQAWTLRVGAQRPFTRGHLAEFLDRAERALPHLQIQHRRNGGLLVAGWNVPDYAVLAPTAGPTVVRDFDLEPGIATARIDWRAYREQVAAHRPTEDRQREP